MKSSDRPMFNTFEIVTHISTCSVLDQSNRFFSVKYSPPLFANYFCFYVGEPFLLVFRVKGSRKNHPGSQKIKEKRIWTPGNIQWPNRHFLHNLPSVFDSFTSWTLISLVTRPTDKSLVEATSNKHSWSSPHSASAFCLKLSLCHVMLSANMGSKSGYE